MFAKTKEKVNAWWNTPSVQARIRNKAFLATLVGILAQLAILFGMDNVDAWQQLALTALNLLNVAGAYNNPTTETPGFGDDKPLL